MGALIDLLGQRFGRLVVITFAGTHGAKRRWNCRCDCGASVEAVTSNLRNGHTSSCGCLRNETTGNRSRTHGLRRSAEYGIWCAMLERCNRPASTSYSNYGARGITVCERWHRFANFFADMGPRPPGMSIERKDNDKGYGPENCKWATKAEQCNNKRTNIKVAFNGEAMSLKQACSAADVPYSRVISRIGRGWSFDRAISEPRVIGNPKRH